MRKIGGILIISFAVLAGSIVAPVDAQTNQTITDRPLSHGYSRPARSPHSSRSAVISPNGMVAASQPLAAQVGLDILKAGGNAIDAAVAVNAMLGLVEPNMNGIGGDLFALVWSAEDEQLYALNATGRAPYAISRDVFSRQGLTEVPSDGPLTWTVPGAVDGWNELLQRFGTMTFSELLSPAISYARSGFPVSEIIQRQWGGAANSLARWPDSASTYLPNGRPPEVGELFKNPSLATTYEAIALGGRDAFYRGDIARRIVAFSEANGGYFTMADFEDHTSEWVEPVTTRYRGYDVWELPPNSQGIIALMMLNIPEGFDITAMGHNTADTLHLITEAKKLAFADRDTFVSDPNANTLPIAELISKSYGAARRTLIDPNQASAATEGNPYEHSETVYLTVVDKDRNAVSLIESIFGNFGSRIVPGDLGFALQNRASGFSLEDGHLNSLEPHKRSLHTNMPGFLTKDGQPLMPFGVMGGHMQPQGHVQVLLNMIDFGMNVQEAGDAARVRHGSVLSVEPGISDEVIAELERRGHTVERTGGMRHGWLPSHPNKSGHWNAARWNRPQKRRSGSRILTYLRTTTIHQRPSSLRNPTLRTSLQP